MITKVQPIIDSDAPIMDTTPSAKFASSGIDVPSTLD